MCRLAIGYQDEPHEREIVRRRRAWRGAAVIAVAVARGSRSDPAVRIGSSVRGAIDMVRLPPALRPARRTRTSAGSARRCVAAMSGRVRVLRGPGPQAEEVIADLLDRPSALPPASRRREGPAPRRYRPRADGAAP